MKRISVRLICISILTILSAPSVFANCPQIKDIQIVKFDDMEKMYPNIPAVMYASFRGNYLYLAKDNENMGWIQVYDKDTKEISSSKKYQFHYAHAVKTSVIISGNKASDVITSMRCYYVVVKATPGGDIPDIRDAFSLTTTDGYQRFDIIPKTGSDLSSTWHTRPVTREVFCLPGKNDPDDCPFVRQHR